MQDWGPEEIVFNAIAWNEGYRFFGCSRDLSKIMKRKGKDNPEYIWLSTSLLKSDNEEVVKLRENPNWIRVN